MNKRKVTGFTLIELIIVIVILGILAVTAAPKFLDLARDAKVAVLNNIAGQIRSTNKLIQTKARVAGLSPSTTNPGGVQDNYVINFGFGSTEVDWRSLCAEARGEAGDQLNFFDFMEIDTTDLTIAPVNNQYAAIGYELPSGGAPAAQGCYVYYDSFDVNCSVVVVDTDC